MGLYRLNSIIFTPDGRCLYAGSIVSISQEDKATYPLDAFSVELPETEKSKAIEFRLATAIQADESNSQVSEIVEETKEHLEQEESPQSALDESNSQEQVKNENKGKNKGNNSNKSK